MKSVALLWTGRDSEPKMLMKMLIGDENGNVLLFIGQK